MDTIQHRSITPMSRGSSAILAVIPISVCATLLALTYFSVSSALTWAGKHADSCMSTSGFVFRLANGPISWVPKKQSCVSLSSTESEYIATSLAV
jgi:hypothetical protein